MIGTTHQLYWVSNFSKYLKFQSLFFGKKYFFLEGYFVQKFHFFFQKTFNFAEKSSVFKIFNNSKKQIFKAFTNLQF